MNLPELEKEERDTNSKFLALSHNPGVGDILILLRLSFDFYLILSLSLN